MVDAEPGTVAAVPATADGSGAAAAEIPIETTVYEVPEQEDIELTDEQVGSELPAQRLVAFVPA